jgi:hypothetical protein
MLHEALQAVDPDTGRSRGYMLLSAGEMRLDLCECSKLCEEVGAVYSQAESTESNVQAGRDSSFRVMEVTIATNGCDSRGAAVNGEVMGCCKKGPSSDRVAPVSEASPIVTAASSLPSTAECSLQDLTFSSVSSVTSNESQTVDDLSSSGMHIPDDGMQCTFNPDGSGSGSQGGGVAYTPQELLHLFLNHTCKYCEKQSAVGEGNGNYVRSIPFVATIE